ncbi:hypothetical protein MASR2M50_10550 [Thauera sp.]
MAVAEQVVPTTVASNQYGHDVAVLSDGGFVVVWWSADDLIYAQRFDAAGAKVGGQIQVSTVESSSYQDYARVAALDNGGFVVAWDTGNLPAAAARMWSSSNSTLPATRSTARPSSTRRSPAPSTCRTSPGSPAATSS